MFIGILYDKLKRDELYHNGAAWNLPNSSALSESWQHCIEKEFHLIF